MAFYHMSDAIYLNKMCSSASLNKTFPSFLPLNKTTSFLYINPFRSSFVRLTCVCLRCSGGAQGADAQGRGGPEAGGQRGGA